jgi:UTP--glucose-1-phosphate uridylyltransferase
MQRRVTKAVFPVAGLGTRFLPATKSVPKEVLTLVDRPLIQYAIDEARAAGITDFIFVTAKGKSALEDYFDHATELEAKLEADGKHELLEALRSSNMESGSIAYIRQHKALGLGHAVHCARKLIGDEPFAVILPDDVIAAETGGSMVAAMEVAPDRASSYGVLDIADDMGSMVAVRGMVEKPKAGTAPSNLAVIGRYILAPTVMANLDRIEPSVGGELQLTDAIAMELTEGRPVYGYRFRGERYDCGSKAGFLQATVAFGLAREELRDEFSDYLHGLVAMRKAAQ